VALVSGAWAVNPIELKIRVRVQCPSSSNRYGNPGQYYLTMVPTPTPEHQDRFDATSEEASDAKRLDPPWLSRNTASLFVTARQEPGNTRSRPFWDDSWGVDLNTVTGVRQLPSYRCVDRDTARRHDQTARQCRYDYERGARRYSHKASLRLSGPGFRAAGGQDQTGRGTVTAAGFGLLPPREW
jgi:hypothetical protein